MSVSRIKTSLIVLGLLLIWMGNMFSTTSLTFIGVLILGTFFIALGVEAITNRRITLVPSAGGFLPARFLEWADVARGILLVSLGVFILGFAVTSLFGTAELIYRYFIRRPGAVLLALSTICFLYAVIKIGGKGDHSKDPHWTRWIDIITSQILPGGFLLLLGLVIAILGLIEFTAPDIFDQLTGSWLEAFLGDL
jgi:hypothetical protein